MCWKMIRDSVSEKLIDGLKHVSFKVTRNLIMTDKKIILILLMDLQLWIVFDLQLYWIWKE